MKKMILVLFFLLLSGSLSYVYSQQFSEIDNDLKSLESLINDTIANTEEQQKLLDGLRESLKESDTLMSSYENIIQGQESSLKDLQSRLTGMSETYRTQSDLSVKYERSSKFWRAFTLIAIPVSAGLGMWLGWRASK